MISTDFIQELLARTDIVQVISPHVSLRKAGQSYKALCPFHEEKTPSFSVNPERQFYHCFGCDASGTAIDFLMKRTGLSFPDVIEDLALRAGMTVVDDKGANRQQQGYKELVDLLEQAQRYYRDQLAGRAGARARAYLDERGVNEDMRTQYEIGYAPGGWDNLLKKLGRDEQQQKQMLAAGLVSTGKSGKGSYDRFRDRLMFPIRSYNGRLIAFGGRALSDDNEPKYLNSPESDVFHKGRELYGAHRLRARHGQIKRLYVVEGYMDVIALAQHGIPDVVATMGTAIGANQLQSLCRYSPCVVMCFDGDSAGRRAAKKALDIAMPQMNSGWTIRFSFLPDGDDPDSFIRREGPGGFTDSVRDTDLYDFIMQSIHDEVGQVSGTGGVTRMLDVAGGYLRRLGDPIARELLLKQLAKRFDLEAGFLKEELLQRGRQPSLSRAAPDSHRLPVSGSANPLLTKIIQLLVHQPSLIAVVDVDTERMRRWSVNGMNFFVEFLAVLRNNPDITTASLLEHWRDSPYEKRLRELAADDFMPEDTDGKRAELEAAMQRLQWQSDKQRLKLLVGQSNFSELSPEQMDEIRHLQTRVAQKSPSL